MLPDFFHVFGYFGHFPFFGPKGSPEISDASQRGGAKILDRSSRGVKKTVDHPQGGKEFRCFQKGGENFLTSPEVGVTRGRKILDLIWVILGT